MIVRGPDDVFSGKGGGTEARSLPATKAQVSVTRLPRENA
jgi:hypothetical protein